MPLILNKLMTLNERTVLHQAAQVSHTVTDGRATTSAIHCWPPSIHYARPRGLELLAGRPPYTAGL